MRVLLELKSMIWMPYSVVDSGGYYTQIGAGIFTLMTKI